jgi:2-dehydropantoate 2-reductase
MNQIFTVSKGSDGQLISTLQDLNHGRETEIDYFNLEIARIGAAATPKIDTPTTRALGEMVKIKSMLRNKSQAR